MYVHYALILQIPTTMHLGSSRYYANIWVRACVWIIYKWTEKCNTRRGLCYRKNTRVTISLDVTHKLDRDTEQKKSKKASDRGRETDLGTEPGSVCNTMCNAPSDWLQNASYAKQWSGFSVYNLTSAERESDFPATTTKFHFSQRTAIAYICTYLDRT